MATVWELTFVPFFAGYQRRVSRGLGPLEPMLEFEPGLEPALQLRREGSE